MLGGRVVEPKKDRARQEKKGTGNHHLPFPSPGQNSKGNQFTDLACTTLTPNAVLLWIHPSDGSASLPMSWPPSQCCRTGTFHRGPRTAEQAEPAPPAPVHLADPPGLIRQIPYKQHRKPGSVQVAQTGATPLHSESCPRQRGR